MSVPVEGKRIYKGQHKNYTINVADVTGTTPITGFTLAFYVKATISGDPLIEKTTAIPTEISLTDPSNGIAELYLAPADTSSLDVGKYYYEIWMTDLNSETRPILGGHFWIMSVVPTFVDLLRKQLDDAGELRVMTVQDEMVYPATLTSLFVSRIRIKDVIGVWIFTDDDHSGTNYYTGGGFSESTGKIWLGTTLVSTAAFVRVSYTWESGVDDETIQWHLDSSKIWVINYTGIEFAYGDASTNLQKGAEAMAVAAAVLGAILTVNGANVAQMGYNFRLHEFEVQTKLWGEGMIAEALFGVYIQRVQWWLATLGKAGEVLLVNQPDTTKKYNIETLIGFTTGAEGDEST